MTDFKTKKKGKLEMAENIDRRSFFKKSAALSVVSLNGIHKKEQGKSQAPFRIRKFNTLGRTGFRVSDIAAGAPSDEAVLSAALDAGVNYIDTENTLVRP